MVTQCSQFIRQVSFVGAIAVLSFILGWSINLFRHSPLPLIYQPPEHRLLKELGGIGPLPDTPPSIELEDAYALNVTQAALFVDAREAALFFLGHIPHSINLPKSSLPTKIASFQTEVSRDQAIVVYCSELDCEDSEIVGKALVAVGYKNVKVFKGGWQEWTAADFPIEK